MPKAQSLIHDDDDDKGAVTIPPDDDDAIGEEDAVGFDVTEDIDVGDLSDQEGGVLPAASRVIGTIKKASVKINLLDNKLPASEDNVWTFKYLNLEIHIGPLGLDGEGQYASKPVFTGNTDLILVYDEAACKKKARLSNKTYNDAWWRTQARYQTKLFMKAINGDVKNVRVNDDFLIALIGREVMFDIKKEKDTFRGEGEFRNSLQNWRAVKTGSDGE